MGSAPRIDSSSSLVAVVFTWYVYPNAIFFALEHEVDINTHICVVSFSTELIAADGRF